MEYLIVFIIGAALGFIFMREYDVVTIEDLEKENRNLRFKSFSNDLTRIKTKILERELKTINDFIKDAEESKENYFITLNKIKKELSMTAKSNR